MAPRPVASQDSLKLALKSQSPEKLHSDAPLSQTLSCWLLDGYLYEPVYSLSLVSMTALAHPCQPFPMILCYLSMVWASHCKDIWNALGIWAPFEHTEPCGSTSETIPMFGIRCEPAQGHNPVPGLLTNCNSLRSRNPGCWWSLGNQDPHMNSRCPSNLLVTGVSSFRHLGVSYTHFLVICGDHPRCDTGSLPCTPIPILSPNSTVPLQIPRNISPVPTGTVLPG